MYATVKFEGVIDKILEKAVENGFAKTKVEALRLAVLELGNKYQLLEREDFLTAKKMESIYEEIKAGKRKVISEKEALR